MTAALAAAVIEQRVATAAEDAYTTYEAFLSPQQELDQGGPSQASAIGTISFDRYLTAARVKLKISGIDPENITAMHLHCGPPSTLGPVIVNFADFGSFTDTIVGGRFSATVKNDDIVFEVQPGRPFVGCPNDLVLPGQANTIAAVDALARHGLLYFNIHTDNFSPASDFYGELRGQIYPARAPSDPPSRLPTR
jgi:hypothetical protein